MKKDEHSFIKGFAAAVAALARESGEPTLAANVISGYGLGLWDFQRARVDDHDLKVIAKLYCEEPSLKGQDKI